MVTKEDLDTIEDREHSSTRSARSRDNSMRSSKMDTDNDESSKMDQTVFLDEVSERTDHGDLEAGSSTTTQKSISTAATERTRRSSMDTLAPLRECSGSFNLGSRQSVSGAFSLTLSEIDTSHRTEHELQLSMYNRLAATALEEACERKAQLCCGSCCDLVKGCIIANALQIVVLTILLSVVVSNDVLVAEFDPLIAKTGGLIAGPIGIAICALGIFGACKFYKWPVMATVIWCIVQLILGCIGRRISLGLMSALFAYPNIHLFLALHSGNITSENYKKTEQYCCCCNNKKSDDDDCCA